MSNDILKEVPDSPRQAVETFSRLIAENMSDEGIDYLLDEYYAVLLISLKKWHTKDGKRFLGEVLDYASASEVFFDHDQKTRIGNLCTKVFVPYFDELKAQDFAKAVREKIAKKTSPYSNDDQIDMLKICAEMRSILINSSQIDSDHKKRLIKLLAKLESEVLSKQGRLSRVLDAVKQITGIVPDTAKDLEPAVELAERVASIAREKSSTQPRLGSEEEPRRLPAPPKGLPDPSN